MPEERGSPCGGAGIRRKKGQDYLGPACRPQVSERIDQNRKRTPNSPQSERGTIVEAGLMKPAG